MEANGDLVFMPELLRVKGNALLSSPESDQTKQNVVSGIRWNGAVVRARSHGSYERPSTSHFYPNRKGVRKPRHSYNRFSGGSSRDGTLQIRKLPARCCGPKPISCN